MIKSIRGLFSRRRARTCQYVGCNDKATDTIVRMLRAPNGQAVGVAFVLCGLHQEKLLADFKAGSEIVLMPKANG